MSIRLMGDVFELEIPSAEKLVLLALADHARDDGTGAYPSIETLARKSSMSRRGVQKIMRRLEEQHGLIAPSQVSRGRLSTEYRITLANREPGSLFAKSQPRTPVRPTANVGTSTANLSASNREPGSPESSRTVSEPSGTEKIKPAASAAVETVENRAAQTAASSSLPLGKEKPEPANPSGYGNVRRLVAGASHLFDASASYPDRKEALKEWAAVNGLPYDGQSVGTALDIADRRVAAKGGGG